MWFLNRVESCWCGIRRAALSPTALLSPPPVTAHLSLVQEVALPSLSRSIIPISLVFPSPNLLSHIFSPQSLDPDLPDGWLSGWFCTVSAAAVSIQAEALHTVVGDWSTGRCPRAAVGQNFYRRHGGCHAGIIGTHRHSHKGCSIMQQTVLWLFNTWSSFLVRYRRGGKGIVIQWDYCFFDVQPAHLILQTFS